MDAFEKWRAEYGIAHPMYDRPNYRERLYASEAFRAGMRRAAEIAMMPDHDGLTVQDAILAEADK